MRHIYSSMAAISALSTLGTVALVPIANAEPLNTRYAAFGKQMEELVFLCESAGDSDAQFRCLLDQASRLNQAKNLARQQGEQDSGGITEIETEPSMHGPSAEAPYDISVSGDTIEYLFTYRIRPRATTDYTRETQILVSYNEAINSWDIDTVYNRAIAPTPCSFASELQGECF